MRAVVITGHGPPEVLQVQERPDPPVGRGDVRVAVKAAGINFADTMARIGMYPDAPKLPCVVGYEVAGEVESVGEGVEDHAVGDRVLAATRFNGYAELVTVPVAQVLPLPKKVSFEEGAAFPVNYGTAYAALVIMGGLKPGERVLIHAAGGGVGISATQIAKGIGAEIFGTASGSKHDAIRGQGVDHAIDYRTMDFEDEIRRITDGEGVDVIMDALGPTSFQKDYRLLRQGGRLIMYGASELQTGSGKRNLVGALRSGATWARSFSPRRRQHRRYAPPAHDPGQHLEPLRPRDRGHGPPTGVLVLRRVPDHVRLHPHERAHDSRSGELVAGKRGGGGDPHPPPRVGDRDDDDHGLCRGDDRPAVAMA